MHTVERNQGGRGGGGSELCTYFASLRKYLRYLRSPGPLCTVMRSLAQAKHDVNPFPPPVPAPYPYPSPSPLLPPPSHTDGVADLSQLWEILGSAAHNNNTTESGGGSEEATLSVEKSGLSSMRALRHARIHPLARTRTQRQTHAHALTKTIHTDGASDLSQLWEVLGSAAHNKNTTESGGGSEEATLSVEQIQSLFNAEPGTAPTSAHPHARTHTHTYACAYTHQPRWSS